MTLYRIDYEAESASHMAEHQEEVKHLIRHEVLVPVEPDLYVMRWWDQGAEAFCRCEKDEADGAVFDIKLLRDKP